VRRGAPERWKSSSTAAIPGRSIDPEAVAAVAAVSNSGLGALFGSGTDQDIGDLKTRVKPEFFQQPDKVKELAQALKKEANELAKVAAASSARRRPSPRPLSAPSPSEACAVGRRINAESDSRLPPAPNAELQTAPADRRRR
jgi:hypothetical protein